MSLVHPNYEIGGCDISYYQNPIRWEILSARISFVIIRSGDGIRPDGQDPKFTENWHDAKAHNVVRGSYWFFRPEINPVQQANQMISLLSSDWGEMGILRPPDARRAARRRPALPVYTGTGGLTDAVADSLTNRALFEAADGVEPRP